MADPPLTYRIRMLGCRVNHAECRDLEQVLIAQGLQPAGGSEAASVEVIHSCAVTTRAAAKSRNAARRAARGPRSELGPPLVLVTGCLAGDGAHQRNASAAGGRDNLIGHAGDTPLVDRVRDRIRRWKATLPAPARSNRPLPILEHTASDTAPARRRGHVRAEVKIQDGCDAHCTFCIIPRLRPTLRSKPTHEVVREVRQLVEAGHLEVVLSGIFIGAWGHETALRRRQTNRAGSPLADLLDAVAQIDGLQRLRLSSMEPGDVDEALLDAMLANDEVIVPHLHLPLQSASDRILRRMNRQYDAAAYRDMLQQVRAALGPGVALTTDIICGFPGETDADFQATCDMALHAGYLHMHVFPFSPRPGTAAARWTDAFVESATIRRRVADLIQLETRPGGLRDRFYRSLLDRPARVIIEQADPNRPGRLLGRCDHWAPMSVDAPEAAIGQIVTAEPSSIDDDVLLARAIKPSIALPRLLEGSPA